MLMRSNLTSSLISSLNIDGGAPDAKFLYLLSWVHLTRFPATTIGCHQYWQNCRGRRCRANVLLPTGERWQLWRERALAVDAAQMDGQKIEYFLHPHNVQATFSNFFKTTDFIEDSTSTTATVLQLW